MTPKTGRVSLTSMPKTKAVENLTLKEARLRAGLTQEALARRADISTRQYARIEAGIGSPHLATLRKIAQALGPKVTVDSIWPEAAA